jgi:hypothetical protein
MQTKKALAALTLLLTSCDSSFSPVPKAEKGWEIAGVVVDAETGLSLKDQRVSIYRIQHKDSFCFSCQLTSVNFYVKTNVRGEFFLAGELQGQFGVGVNKPDAPYCSDGIGLGEIGSGSRRVVLKLKHRPCPLVF